MRMRATTFVPLAAALVLACSTSAGALGCSGSDGAVTASAAPAATTDAPAADPAPVAPTPSAPVVTPAAPDASTGPMSASPPGALACLAQLYGGTAVPMKSSPGGWALRLPDGTQLEWDDAQTKTYDDKLATPDLEDTLAMPYTLGLIKAMSTVNDDPGRIRSDALFKSTFGATSAAVQQGLVPVDFVGQTVQIHTRAAAALTKVSTHLKQLVAQTPSLGAYVTGTLGGTFDWRPIANTNRMSAHSYGIAIDIVVSKSNYWEWEQTSATAPLVWKNEIPQAIVDAFEAEGFAWGGRWYHYDTMHFEYRPELFAAACKP
jgi:hypothetical protein